MNPPSYIEVATVLRSLLSGRLTRQEAAEWATRYFIGDVRVADTHLWRALELIGAADLCSTDRLFLYEDADFQECLAQLEKQS
jgi:hypothetical protein